MLMFMILQAGLAAAGAGALAAKLSAGAGIATAGAGILNTILTNRANKRENELAYKRRQEEVAKMNQYNSPASQVLRLRAAGLSPGLAYGGAGQVTGDQTQIADPIPTQYNPAPFADSAAIIDSMVNAREQMNKNDQNIADLALKNYQSLQACSAAGLNDAQKKEILDMLPLRQDNIISDTNLKQEVKQSEKFKQRLTRAQCIDIQKHWGVNDAIIKRYAVQNNLDEAAVYRMYSMLPVELADMNADQRMKMALAGKYGQEIESLATQQFCSYKYLALAEKGYNLDVRKQVWFEGMDENRFNLEVKHYDLQKWSQESWYDLSNRQFNHQKTMDWTNYATNTAFKGFELFLSLPSKANPIGFGK